MRRRRGNTEIEGRAGGEETLNKDLKLKHLQLTLSLSAAKKLLHMDSHSSGTEAVQWSHGRKKNFWLDEVVKDRGSNLCVLLPHLTPVSEDEAL